ncbi:MAG: hypothetical protein ACI8VY_000438, partial [Cellvibrionaceae bacterium]
SIVKQMNRDMFFLHAAIVSICQAVIHPTYLSIFALAMLDKII